MTKIEELMALADAYADVIWRARTTGKEERDALRQALEAALKPGEPVAWQVHPFDYGIGHEGVYARTSLPQQVDAWERKGWTVQPLYTAPPEQTPPPRLTWVELSTVIKKCRGYVNDDEMKIARAVETAVRNSLE